MDPHVSIQAKQARESHELGSRNQLDVPVDGDAWLIKHILAGICSQVAHAWEYGLLAL
jgi:hypothetical protein